MMKKQAGKYISSPIFKNPGHFGDAVKMVCVLFAAILLSEILYSFNIGDQNLIMVYILSVLIISRITTGYAYGVIASVLSVFIFDYLITDPRLGFSITKPEYPITFTIMLLVAVITSTLTIQMKTQARLAVERERRTELLYELNKKLLTTRSLEGIIDLTNDHIMNHVGSSVIFYKEDPIVAGSGFFKQAPGDIDVSFMSSPSEQIAAHWAFEHQKSTGSGTETKMGSEVFYIPIVSKEKTLGALGVSCANGKLLSQDNEYFLNMVASQIAMALELQFLWDEQQRILIESEKEKMRSNLLRAISHDLRTPLTGILGASSVLLEQSGFLNRQTTDKLISDIMEESQWLIRMVENLLSVTRIHEESMKVTKDLEAVEEIIEVSIRRTRNRFPDKKINVKVPDELLMVPMDGILISQVIINLLENAIKYAGANTSFEVNVKKKNDFAVFEVIDNGTGIPERDLSDLFKTSIHREEESSDSARGMGIGLSICESILKAHNGTIEAFIREEGGTVFKFVLPLEAGSNAVNK